MKRIVFGLTLSLVVACLAGSVTARDLDGRYANSPLKQWFDNLKSGRGLCCSMADGQSVADPDGTLKTAIIGSALRIIGSMFPTTP
jgi:hypothetical protein